VCLCVNHGGANYNLCTWKLVILHGDPDAQPGSFPSDISQNIFPLNHRRIPCKQTTWHISPVISPSKKYLGLFPWKLNSSRQTKISKTSWTFPPRHFPFRVFRTPPDNSSWTVPPNVSWALLVFCYFHKNACIFSFYLNVYYSYEFSLQTFWSGSDWITLCSVVLQGGSIKQCNMAYLTVTLANLNRFL